jgi:hypothetical protein
MPRLNGQALAFFLDLASQSSKPRSITNGKNERYAAGLAEAAAANDPVDLMMLARLGVAESRVVTLER